MFLLTPIFAQQAKIKDIEEGANFITTNIYSAKDDAKIFKLYEGLQISDVSDGMEMVLLWFQEHKLNKLQFMQGSFLIKRNR